MVSPIYHKFFSAFGPPECWKCRFIHNEDLLFQKFVMVFSTVKLGNKEWFDKEQIGIKEPFPVTNLPFTS